ncbi:hypothetical protein ACT7CR_28885 [Bacillus paranthracis]
MRSKAKAAHLEQEGVGTPDVEALFCLVGRRETTDCSSRCSWMF